VIILPQRKSSISGNRFLRGQKTKRTGPESRTNALGEVSVVIID
jgi:hypothetical protein